MRPTPASQERLFLALWPTDEVRDGLTAWRQSSTSPRGPAARPAPPAAREDAQALPGPARWRRRKARVVAPGQLHLTLHFIGSVPSSDVPALQDALAVEFTAFELELGVAEWWRHGLLVVRPRLASAALDELHAKLGAALRAGKLPCESTRFVPHLTLVREASEQRPLAPLPALRWPVLAYRLVRSANGYHDLAEYPASDAAGR